MKRNYLTAALLMLFIILSWTYISINKQADLSEDTIIEEIPKEIGLEEPKEIPEPVEEEIIEEPKQEIIIQKPKEYTIEIFENQLIPKELTIEVGSTVNWINNDVRNYKIYDRATKREFYSDTIKGGETFSHTFNAPGTFEYQEVTRVYMQGKIIVEEPSIGIGNAIGIFKTKNKIIPITTYFSIVLIALNLLIFKKNNIIRKLIKR